ncbi:hypothetical protein ACN47E_003514 [Coniothyrium glycines]
MATAPTAPNSMYFTSTTELADLGTARAEQDTAAIGDRDFALHTHAPVTVQAGRAPKGLEGQVFAWNTFQYTTEERDDREELKGDLHEGQLHRQNRAAAQSEGMSMGMGGGGRGRAGRVAGGRGQARGDGQVDALCAGRRPEGRAPPLAKGMAEEMDKSMFWDGPLV